MPKGRKWTSEEIEYLHESWGLKPVPSIAKYLNRTEIAVTTKAKRIGLGAASTADEFITARQASNLLGVDVHAVTDYWIPKCGLKARKRVVRISRKMTMIKFSDLVEWLKNNQDKWDSRRVELYALGMEEDWLKEKRKADMKLPIRRNYKWTKQEDMIAIHMHKAGYTYKQIGDRLGRSKVAVKKRLSRLDVWGTGEYIGDKAM